MAVLLFFDVGAEDAHFLIAIGLKVKAVLLAEAQLQEIIVEGLLAHLNFLGGIFEAVAHEIAIAIDSIVELAPEGHFLNDVRD